MACVKIARLQDKQDSKKDKASNGQWNHTIATPQSEHTNLWVIGASNQIQEKAQCANNFSKPGNYGFIIAKSGGICNVCRFK